MDILRRPLPIFFVVDAKPYHCLCQYQAALLHPPSFFTPHAPPIDHLIPFPLRPGFLEQSHQRSASAEWSVLALKYSTRHYRQADHPWIPDRSKDARNLDIEVARSPKPPARVTQPNISGGVDSGGTGRRGFQSRDQEQPDSPHPSW